MSRRVIWYRTCSMTSHKRVNLRGYGVMEKEQKQLPIPALFTAVIVLTLHTIAWYFYK